MRSALTAGQSSLATADEVIDETTLLILRLAGRHRGRGLRAQQKCDARDRFLSTLTPAFGDLVVARSTGLPSPLVEGKNFGDRIPLAQGRYDATAGRLPPIASAARVRFIVASGGPPFRRAAKRDLTIPIVLHRPRRPVWAGVVPASAAGLQSHDRSSWQTS